MGKAPGWLASGLGVYQDYQKYSGGDFVIAAGADIVLPTAGGIAGAAVTANPITGAVIGAIGATLEDKVASIAKDKYAVTDGKKHDNSN